jgi:hypothetical protein
MAGGIVIFYGIILDIAKSVPTLRVSRAWHDGVGLNEAVKIRVIGAGKVINLKQKPLSRGLAYGAVKSIADAGWWTKGFKRNAH